MSIDISFIDSKHAYLPELPAYIHFFKNAGITCEIVECPEQAKGKIVWIFTGFSRFKGQKKQTLVHDYASLSVPPFSRLKDCIKRVGNRQPSLRIFLNQAVKNQLNFTDGVPFIFRDMGVPTYFFQEEKNDSIEYDFVYVGSISKKRNTDQLIRHFGENLPHHSLILVGNTDSFFKKIAKKYPNVSLNGAVPHTEVPAFLAKCKFAINIVPDIYPFNVQTSTKLLEYLAANKKVLSNRNEWSDTFKKNNNLSYFDFEKITDINPHTLEAHTFSRNEMSAFRWEVILKKSNLLVAIQRLLSSS